MKKYLLALTAGLFNLIAVGQNFTISGSVTEDVSGNPVANHPVYIMADSTQMNYYNVVYTDALGNYSDVIPGGAMTGPNVDFMVWSEVCNGNYYNYTFSNNQGTSGSATADFTVCQNQGTGSGCNANFVYTDSANTGYVYFMPDAYNVSGYTYYWSFGDGIYSGSMDPWHYYSQPGTYTACLTVDSAGVCSSYSCQSITITGGGNAACVANFYWMIDTTNNQIIVVNNSTNSFFTTYFWDFGDGSTGAGQIGSHTYANYGSYLICLTISDQNCTATYCDTITYMPFQGSANDRSGFTINIITPNSPNGMTENNTVFEKMIAFPNPAVENITLNFGSKVSGQIEIIITDLVGKVVTDEFKNVSQGSNTLNYSLNDFERGMYIISLREMNSGKTESIRFIRQ